MISVRDSHQLRQLLLQAKQNGHTVAFVPTMGALHHGHISLVEAAKLHCELVVVSIFVNPTQFNEQSDFDRYPRNEQADLDMLRKAYVDIVFLPEASEMYADAEPLLNFDFEGLDAVMEGKHRPGHFQGVVTIVDKFFSLISPNAAFFGQKDFQQLAIIQLLAKRRHPHIQIVGCPIHREANGLAMSSRNTLLNDADRSHAGVLHRALLHIHQAWLLEPAEKLRDEAMNLLTEAGVEVEYLEIADSQSLKPFSSSSNHEAVACLAVRYGAVRLIDNILLPPRPTA